MVLLDQLWDDVVAGPQPDRGLKHLKKVFTSPKGQNTFITKYYIDIFIINNSIH